LPLLKKNNEKGTQFLAGKKKKKSTREQNRGPRANLMSQCTSQKFGLIINK